MDSRPEFKHELQIPSDPAEGQRIQNLLVEELQSRQCPEKVLFSIKLAVEEALVNAIKHGNQMDRGKLVHIRYSIEADEFRIEIRDEGPGFRPEDVPDPTAPENLERPCGRGLLLMRAYMTECDFLPPGNVCRMRRVLQ